MPKMPQVPIKGFLPMTTMDYKGKVASIIFLQGCNFRCPFCHNPELVEVSGDAALSEEEVISYLQDNREWIDAVVISGGEPTMHKGLAGFIARLKSLGLFVKLQTNGTNPGMLKELAEKKLLDYISMDIKAPPEKYCALSGSIADISAIEKSIAIIKESGTDYSFHTTVAPELSLEDIKKIGKWLCGAKRFCIQQFRPEKTLDASYAEKKPHTKEELQKMAEAVKDCFDAVEADAS